MFACFNCQVDQMKMKVWYMLVEGGRTFLFWLVTASLWWMLSLEEEYSLLPPLQVCLVGRWVLDSQFISEKSSKVVSFLASFLSVQAYLLLLAIQCAEEGSGWGFFDRQALTNSNMVVAWPAVIWSWWSDLSQDSYLVPL